MNKPLTTGEAIQALNEGKEIKYGHGGARYFMNNAGTDYESRALPFNVAHKLIDQGLMVLDRAASCFPTDVYVGRDTKRGQVAAEAARKEKAARDARAESAAREEAKRRAEADILKVALSKAGLSLGGVRVLEDGCVEITLSSLGEAKRLIAKLS